MVLRELFGKIQRVSWPGRDRAAAQFSRTIPAAPLPRDGRARSDRADRGRALQAPHSQGRGLAEYLARYVLARMRSTETKTETADHFRQCGPAPTHSVALRGCRRQARAMNSSAMDQRLLWPTLRTQGEHLARSEKCQMRRFPNFVEAGTKALFDNLDHFTPASARVECQSWPGRRVQ